MKLYIYNPEHDFCLANDSLNLLLPRAIREQKRRYCYMMVYMAEKDDIVIVDDVEEATRRLEGDGHRCDDVRLMDFGELAKLDVCRITEIVTWGWDRNVCARLRSANPRLERLLPTEEDLEEVRRLSSRVFVAQEVLPRLLRVDETLVGQMTIFEGGVEELAWRMEEWRPVVMKAPWSSSGRGVRMVKMMLNDNDKGWARNVLMRQGSIIVEPLYDKVMDFAMEFYIGCDGRVSYQGLSIFTTRSGTYQSNVVATEKEKETLIRKYASATLLEKIRMGIINAAEELLAGRYHGPFGVDMLVATTTTGTAICPCIELNLRMTMGHVALRREGEKNRK